MKMERMSTGDEPNSLDNFSRSASPPIDTFTISRSERFDRLSRGMSPLPVNSAAAAHVAVDCAAT